MIFYRLDDEGGFTAGDSDTRITSYAYPTSTHATRAKRSAMAVAKEMLANERRYGLEHESHYDNGNWCWLQVRNR